jgi:D-serine deaminase-like pyridoxal phosphate-dependent protein
VQPGRPALDLARLVLASPGLKFMGLMGYEGHVVALPDRQERVEKASDCLKLLADTVDLLRKSGLDVPVVSASGTGTFDIGGGFPGVTEIQVGSYATMDGHYQQVGVPFEPALTVLASVISTPFPGLVILDAGLKSLSTDQGLPTPLGLPGAEIKFLAEEHAWLFLPPDVALGPGAKVRLLPAHGCTTINLHDQYYVCRDRLFLETWPVAARGKSQ